MERTEKWEAKIFVYNVAQNEMREPDILKRLWEMFLEVCEFICGYAQNICQGFSYNISTYQYFMTKHCN